MSTTNTVDTVVIGAGHAGLAVSRLLTDAGRDHVVLDRGRVAERWRTERWDSLHLLTPNWMIRLPGWPYAGPAPDWYLTPAASSAISRGTPRRSARRCSSGTTVLSRRQAPVRRRRYRVAHATGAPGARATS